MTTQQIKDIQSKIGVKADGIFGKVSRTAAKAYLIRLAGNANRFPADNPASIQAYYGDQGEKEAIMIDVSGIDVRFIGRKVNRIKCHKRVAQPLVDILHDIADTPHKWVLEGYGGVYEQRLQRGGTKPSKHCWGIAIDLATATNRNSTRWPEEADMPFEVMEIFASYGWLPAGVWWGRDAMHFQATKLM